MIKKWRVAAMLNYLKNMILNEKTNEEILKVIENYILFTKEIKDDK